MRLSVTIATILTPAFSAALHGQPLTESPAAYEIVAATSIPVLPSPLRAFLEAHIEAVRQSATAGLSPVPENRPSPAELGRHYVMLDAAADQRDAGGRRCAVLAFPRDRGEATKLFKQSAQENGGTLPWVLCERRTALVQAFRDGPADAIFREAGAVIHFATDASLPFNTTADLDGAAADCLRWSATQSASGTELQHRTVRQRYHNAFIARLRDRLAYEVRVAQQRYSPGRECIIEVFDALSAAYETLDGLAAIDAETTRTLGIADAEGFDARVDQYYEKLADRAASIIESRLEAAALLGANLIGAAWAEAGSPPPSKWIADPTPAANGTRPADQVKKPFVGSRDSTVFHRAACKHVDRIKPQNQVCFATAKEALDAGRKPCQSCRPGGP